MESDYRLNFWVLLYIISGEGVHYIDFEEYTYRAGNMIIMQKNQVHRFRVNHQVRGYILIFNEPFFFDPDGTGSNIFLEFFNRPWKSPVLTFDNSEGTANRAIMELVYHEYSRAVSDENCALVRSLIQSFILSLEEYSREEKERSLSSDFRTYDSFRVLVDENFSSRKTVEDYAKLMNISKKTINSATRSVAGLSAKEFIIERVILEIKRYLSMGDLLTYEIADKLGFDEPSNMAKFFKRYAGMSPSSFKESLK